MLPRHTSIRIVICLSCLSEDRMSRNSEFSEFSFNAEAVGKEDVVWLQLLLCRLRM